MLATCASPRDLGDERIAAWLQIVQNHSAYGSPFLHPVYAQVLGEHRPGVEVIALQSPDGAHGFLPFERTAPRTGGPLGARLADFQGLVAAPGAQWSPGALLAAARLDCLAFDHLVLDGSPIEECVLARESSPAIDLSMGFAECLASLRAAGSELAPQAERKLKGLERRARIDFQWQEDSPEAFAALIEWKREQRRRTNTIDVLGWPGVVSALDQLRTTDRDGFSGVLSTLRIDGRLAAAHLGLRAGPVLHWWFTGYDRSFGKHSPGLLLLLLAAEAATDAGVRQIDLGKGPDAYKSSFANTEVQVGVGALDSAPLRRLARAGWSRLRLWAKSSPLRAPAQYSKQLWRRWRARSSSREGRTS